MKVIASGVMKKTGVFVKKAEKQSGKMVKALKKEWKRERPQREEYKKKIGKVVNKARVRGMELLKEGVKNSIKIGGDVAHTIKKDIKEIRANK